MAKMFLLLTSLVLISFSVSLYLTPLDDNLDSILRTKAICDDDNFCQDYEIFCDDSKLIRMSPITGAAVQFSKDWQDPRPKGQINNLCS